MFRAKKILISGMMCLAAALASFPVGIATSNADFGAGFEKDAGMKTLIHYTLPDNPSLIGEINIEENKRMFGLKSIESSEVSNQFHHLNGDDFQEATSELQDLKAFFLFSSDPSPPLSVSLAA